VKEGIHLFT